MAWLAGIQILIFVLALSCHAAKKGNMDSGDIDDGIPIDDDISQYDNLKKIDENVSFMVLNQWARSQTTLPKRDDIIDEGDASINSVRLGPGSTVHGDIIIIDNSRGDTTAISRKKK